MITQIGKSILAILLVSSLSAYALMTRADIKPPKQYALTDVPVVHRSASPNHSILIANDDQIKQIITIVVLF